jgi:hypothetical protein
MIKDYLPDIKGKNVELIAIKDIKPYGLNNKNHPPEQLRILMNMITEFGFTDPIVIDENNVIICGHGRVLACQELKFTKIPAYKVTDWTDAQKKAFRIGHNKVADLGDYNIDNIRFDLQELRDLEFDMDLTAISSTDIDRILADFNDEDSGEMLPPTTAKPKTSRIMIDCLEDDAAELKDKIELVVKQSNFKEVEVSIIAKKSKK